MEMFEQFEKKMDATVDRDMEKSSNKMVREALKSSGLNNFESALDAVTDFLGELSLFDPDVAFGRAADSIFVAAAAFDAIDGNSDKRLSRQELSVFARGADADSQFAFEWILMHFDAIGKAFGGEKEGISKDDLNYAGNFFRGLDFANKNFDQMAMLDGEPFLSFTDIERYLIAHGKELQPRQREGLMQLAIYLRSAAARHGRTAIDAEELSELDLESLKKKS